MNTEGRAFPWYSHQGPVEQEKIRTLVEEQDWDEIQEVCNYLLGHTLSYHGRGEMFDRVLLDVTVATQGIDAVIRDRDGDEPLAGPKDVHYYLETVVTSLQDAMQQLYAHDQEIGARIARQDRRDA